MKLTGKRRSLRGQITPVAGKSDTQLILNDQLINRGLRITRFEVWPERLFGSSTSNLTYNAILSYARLADANVFMDAGDNTQIAWSYGGQAGGTAIGVPPVTYPDTNLGDRQIIDPDHIVNRDLFVSFRFSANAPFNYLIECEFLELTNDEAIITIIKENSQNVDPII